MSRTTGVRLVVKRTHWLRNDGLSDAVHAATETELILPDQAPAWVLGRLNDNSGTGVASVMVEFGNSCVHRYTLETVPVAVPE